jgi:MAF protein
MQWRVAAVDLNEQAYVVAEPLLSAINVALAKVGATQANADEIILAADTLVVVDDDILGKPGTPNEARNMLGRLRGRAHQVLTGVVLQREELQWAGVVPTRVTMRDYTQPEVEDYVNRGEPFDKAGGYAVQDRTFRPVEGLEGCYLNVVGLPLCAVAAGLNAVGIPTASGGTPACTYCERGESLVRSG